MPSTEKCSSNISAAARGWATTAASRRSRFLLKVVASHTDDADRGQLSHSICYMGEVWGWPNSRVQRFIAVLIAEKMILVETQTEQRDHNHL